MDEETKWGIVLTTAITVAILTFGGIIVNNSYHAWQTDQIAIKQGLVQKVEQTRVIWVKP